MIGPALDWLARCQYTVDLQLLSHGGSTYTCGSRSVLEYTRIAHLLGKFNNHQATKNSIYCLTSHRQASISQRRICLDSCTCCDTEIEVSDLNFYLTQSQFTDTGPARPCNARRLAGSPLHRNTAAAAAATTTTTTTTTTSSSSTSNIVVVVVIIIIIMMMMMMIIVIIIMIMMMTK